MMRRVAMCAGLLLALLAPVLAAAPAAGVRAFLDRSHVSLGDVVTLNLQSSGALGTPDLAPLGGSFEVLGSSRSSNVEIVNGHVTRTAQLGIALKPLRAGTLVIPALAVGNARTQPLTLEVGAGPAGGSGKIGDAAFMEAGVLSSAPYVGQQTVYTVRLYYLPGVDGSLGDPTADGARLVKLDQDRDYMVERNGYAYKVIEYRWALIPQRAGPVTVQGPVFQGRRLDPGNAGPWLGNPNSIPINPNALLNGLVSGLGQPVNAAAPVVQLDTRAAPANAGKPWLPARNVQLALTGLPANGAVDAGQPLTLTLKVAADGQPADALPDPELPPIAGARVYPDQPQDATDASGEWLHGARTRSFAVVPDRNGTLTIPAITLAWWNVETDGPEVARLPAHTLQVSGVSAPAPAAPTASARAPAAAVAPASTITTPRLVPAAGAWRLVALASLALWALAGVLGGGWWWRARRAVALQPPEAPQAATTSTDARKLQRAALEAARSGDAAACEHALLAWARAERAAITGIGALREALADAAQQQALDALERARWERGDADAAGLRVAAAFAHGFAWRAAQGAAAADAGALPPLYPS